MMHATTASKFDSEKFRKVHVLIAGGATVGERAAAKARADVLAAKAGLTFLEAVSKMDGKPKAAKPANFFDGFDDWMEEKEPGHKARAAQTKSDRASRKAQRVADLLARFGSVKAVFDPTPSEALIMTAVEPLVSQWGTYEEVDGTIRRTVRAFANVDNSHFQIRDVDLDAIAAVKTAYAFPDSVRSTFDELRAWNTLSRNRADFTDHGEFYFELPVELRVELLREQMRTLPVTGWDDMEARFEFKAYDWQQQWLDDLEFSDPEWSRLYSDLQFLRSMMPTTPAQPERRTNADKQKAVMSILDAHPELSDRQIAKLAGVSPQTVNNHRRHASGQG